VHRVGNIFIRAAIALLIAALFSCNPAKKLQKQDDAIDELKAKWINDWVKNNPCPPSPEIDLDSICKIVFSIDKESNLSALASKNTILVDNDSMPFADGFIELPGKKFYSTDSSIIRHIAVPYEDTRHIKLLEDTVNALMVRIALLQGGKTQQNTDCSKEIATANKSKNKWIWLFIAACVVIVGGLASKVYRLINPVSILPKL